MNTYFNYSQTGFKTQVRVVENSKDGVSNKKFPVLNRTRRENNSGSLL